MNNSWIKINQLNFFSLHVRANTEWKFIEFITDDNISGISEITDTQLQSPVSKIVSRLSNKLRGEKLFSENELINIIDNENYASKDLSYATAVSGIRTAFLDLMSKRIELPLNSYLKELNPSLDLKNNITVPLYANINRSMLPNDQGPVDRSPESFAKRAKEFEQKGFLTIKCAPFDECKSPFSEKNKIPPEASLGLERISEIRNNIAKETKLFVDCHSRFDLDSSYYLHDELLERGVNWFEEPVDPEKNEKEMIKINNYSKITTAGAEMTYGADNFRRLLSKEVIDIVMPDVKFCGGPTEVINLDKSIEDSSKKISMHCPSGPVSLLTSAHITSSISSTLPLEHAVKEVPWRQDVLIPNEKIINGEIHLPKEIGIGASLNPEIIHKNGKFWQE